MANGACKEVMRVYIVFVHMSCPGLHPLITLHPSSYINRIYD